MREKKKLKFKNLKLAAKTSITVGLILFVCLTILIAITIIQAGTAVSRTINGEFLSIAARNGLMIQAMMNDAASTAKNLENALSGIHNENDSASSWKYISRESRIYPVKLKEINYEIENYFLNTAWSVVGNNPDIVGIGVFFEPNAFDSSVRDYAIYVDKEDAKNRT